MTSLQRPTNMLFQLTIEKEILVGFACGHVYHLSHVEPERTNEEENEAGDRTPRSSSPLQPSNALRSQAGDDPSLSTPRTVGPKVTTARLLRDRIGAGCRICARGKDIEDMV